MSGECRVSPRTEDSGQVYCCEGGGIGLVVSRCMANDGQIASHERVPPEKLKGWIHPSRMISLHVPGINLKIATTGWESNP